MDKAFIDEFALECDKAIYSNSLKEIDTMLEKLSKFEQENSDDDVGIAHILYSIGNLYNEKARITKECIGGWKDDNFPKNHIVH